MSDTTKAVLFVGIAVVLVLWFTKRSGGTPLVKPVSAPIAGSNVTVPYVETVFHGVHFNKV